MSKQGSESQAPGAEARNAASGWECLGLLFLVVVCVGSGLWGRDFGSHWDEPKLLSALLRPDAPTFLPGWYNYPSLSFDIGLAALLPDWLRLGDRRLAHDFAQSDVFLLRMRAIFAVISGAAIVWTYALVRVWRRNGLEALLSSAALGLSWEFSYHARWVAPDALLAQFAIATSLLCLLAMRRPAEDRWLILASIAAGLGASAKYPGGILIVPVLAVVVGRARRQPRSVFWSGVAFALFASTFFFATPGALWEPDRFANDVAYEIVHYGSEGHLGHDVRAGLSHAAAIVGYLGGVFFSPFPWLSWIVFGFSLLGWWCLFRESRQEALVLLLAPVLYFFYFSQQGVMVVRNLLFLAPFLCLSVGVGIGFCFERFAGASPRPLASVPLRRGLRYAVAGFCLVLVFANASWLVAAARSIVDYAPPNSVRAAADHVARHPEDRFHLSARLVEAFNVSSGGLPENAVEIDLRRTRPSAGDFVVIFASEARTPLDPGTSWPANRVGRYRVFGPRDVNFDFYPNWEGPDRVVVMPSEVFERMREETEMRLPIERSGRTNRRLESSQRRNGEHPAGRAA